MPRYAIPDDYAAFTDGGSVTQTLLDRAREDVDVALIGARYDVDVDGLAADPTIRAVLRDATCAQAQYLDELGDTSGAGLVSDVQSASIGSVSFTKGSAGSVTGGGGLGSRAAKILYLAGLLTLNPIVTG